MISDNTTDLGLTLVLGGTGKTGRRLANRLREHGHTVRIGSRSASPGFDWEDPRTWGAALEGVQSVYITYAPDLAVPGAVEAIQAFTDRAVASGVKRLVLLSGRGELEAQRCERVVQQAGIAWTIIRSSWFNQNFSEAFFREMVEGGTIALPAGDVAEPFVDCEDIADLALAALTEPGHEGQLYEVTGPELLTFRDVARLLSDATGREIRYVPLTDEQFAAAMAEEGVPEDAVQMLTYLFREVLDGRNSHLTDGVQRALGREPRDFATYVKRAAAEGAWTTATASSSSVEA